MIFKFPVKLNAKTLLFFRTQIGLISIFLITSSLNGSKIDVHAAESPTQHSTEKSEPLQLSAQELDKARALIEKIADLSASLNETVTNSVGVRIPRFENSYQVGELIDELEKALQGSGVSPKLRPESARNLVLTALQILYVGRGNTSPRDGTGWYPLNRGGDQGLDEIERILSRALLDKAGKDALIAFVQAHDFKSPTAKKSAGFPPQFNIGDDGVSKRVLAQVMAAPVAPAYQSLSRFPGLELTLNEFIDQAHGAGKISAERTKNLKEFVETVENNHYDKSVETLNDPNRDFVNYFGREEESRQIVNALTKMDKGHILMTGKAGVGKTTILKMLSDAFIQGKIKIRDEASPMILELPITAVTNPNDPSVVKSMVQQAEFLSKALNRRVILYIDEAHVSTAMTRNALKGFLANMIEPLDKNSRVHVIFSTTSQESREFLSDTAFSRRFTEIHVPEFNRDQTIQLIKQSYEPIWKRHHRKKGYEFVGISDDAYEYAFRYANFEQPHAGNPTSTKEILEAAIVSKMNANAGKHSGPFMLESQDVQQYIRDNLHISLVPGDPELDKKFQEKWDAFNQDYVGNDGAKATIEEIIRSHFGQMHKNKMTALVNFGPPGGGKSYGAEMIAKHFFNKAMLTINGAEFSNGGTGAESKLIGSPTGHVGSEEQRAILTKFIKDNPQGGVIKIEEADYLHQDVVRLFTNMITDKKFMDGLGKEWETSKYILWLNSNVGQDLMIPIDTKNKMTWEQFNTRRRQGTEKVIGKNGKEIERVRPELLDEVFEQFIQAIVTQSNPGGDTSIVSQEAQKQKRRYKAIYTLPPSKEELVEAANIRISSFIRDAKTDYGVEFEIPQNEIDRIIDIDHYEFEKGYSYVIDQLEDKVFRNLTYHLHERGKKVRIYLEDYNAEVNGNDVPSQRLLVQVEGHEPVSYALGAVDKSPKNPWGDNAEMMSRIRNLSAKIYEAGIRGNDEVIHRWKSQLKLKASDWNTRPVFTLLGTSGNGKTERFKALAKALYGNEQAVFSISGVTSKFDLSRFLRPPTGIQGGKEQTEFERWFLSRQKAGGGVILFDELLSFSGLSKNEIGLRLEAFNELYDLLDEGYIRFGNTRYDARGFIIGITGNSLQEAFDRIGDDPDSEQLVEKVRKSITHKEILEYFSQAGMDPPKVARLGIIDVLGPQSKSVTLSVAKSKLFSTIEKIQHEGRRSVEISVDDAVLDSLVERVTTAKLGMRQVNRAFDAWVKGPLNAIRADFPEARKIEMKLTEDKKTQWIVDGKEVALEGIKINDAGLEERNWNRVAEFGTQSTNRTPQLEDLPESKKLKYTEETLHSVATHELYGHWMTEVLLNRHNPADAVSLIAGDNYLGYVRNTEEELYRIDDLTKLFKRQIMLQAGHRAVFLQGQFATGGGHDGSARDPKSYPSDDIGKIDRIQDRMISNRILPDLSERSSSEQKHMAKLFLNEVLDEVADDMIREGVNSGVFKSIYDQLIQVKFLSKADLDRFVETMDFSSFGSPDEFFLKHMSKALKTVNQRWSQKKQIKQTKNNLIVKSLAMGVLDRLYREAEMRTLGQTELHQKISAMHEKMVEGFDGSHSSRDVSGDSSKTSVGSTSDSTTCGAVFEWMKVAR